MSVDSIPTVAFSDVTLLSDNRLVAKTLACVRTDATLRTVFTLLSDNKLMLTLSYVYLPIQKPLVFISLTDTRLDTNILTYSLLSDLQAKRITALTLLFN